MGVHPKDDWTLPEDCLSRESLFAFFGFCAGLAFLFIRGGGGGRGGVQDCGVVSVMQVSFLENFRDIEMSASCHAFICPNNQIQETRPNNSFI